MALPTGPEGEISIHKALAGLDDSVDAPVFDDSDFNPQGPRGPRPIKF